MIRRSGLASGAGLPVIDLAALALALPPAYALYERLYGSGRLVPMSSLGIPLAITLVLWGGAAWLARVYERPEPSTGGTELVRVLLALALVALGAAALAFFAKDTELSRLLIVIYFAVSAALLVAQRGASRVIARAARRRGYAARRYAVVGTGALAREVVELIGAHPEWGLELAGFVELEGRGPRSRGPVLGTIAQLDAILEREVLDRVIFAVPRDRLSRLEHAIELCEELGVEAQISLGTFRHGPARMTVEDLDGIPMLAFTRTPSDTVALWAKRLFDLLVTAAVLVALSPVFLAIAAAIRLDSPGPILFRQRRVGLNGREFRMLKFRSMYVDAEARLEALRACNEMSGPVFKMKDDPRVTRVGRLLRRASLDELPQFWNVLRGEMSVVGPRPPIPAEVRQYKRWQRRRLSVRPGITCIWQISGRNDVDFDRWMELDLEYIDHWSLWGDLEICLRTIPAVLSARGAR